MASADVIIIGGGISGAATGLGLVEEGAGKVLIFDEQLPSQRLSRGNFGLTWFMCKAVAVIYAIPVGFLIYKGLTMKTFLSR